MPTTCIAELPCRTLGQNALAGKLAPETYRPQKVAPPSAAAVAGASSPPPHAELRLPKLYFPCRFSSLGGALCRLAGSLGLLFSRGGFALGREASRGWF